MGIETVIEGGGEPAPFNFVLIPGRKPEELLANVRYALTLGLPDVRLECEPHDGVLSIAGGGPSLADTYGELEGCIAAVNGSLNYLHSKGVKPNICGVCHPTESMADILEANPEVTYFVASCVHPKVFDKLIAAGCKIYLWHMTEQSIEGLSKVLDDHYPDGWVGMTGGTTMGLRWLNLGYYLGFRKFHLHGMDSSFRETSHAYPDHQDAKEWITFDGYKTRIPFIGQVVDFIDFVEKSRTLKQPPEFKLFGDGLLQSRYKQWLEKNPPFEWPSTDTTGRVHVMRESAFIGDFLSLIPKRGTAIQAGGNVGVYARKLAQHFKKVFTFEPERHNFDCLERNTASYPNIIRHRAAIGEKPGWIATATHEDENCGAVHVSEGESAPLVRIDDIVNSNEGCDLIWLDVEGYEEPALKGAAATIAKYHPAVIIEEQPILAEMHGFDPFGAVTWLKEREYRRVIRIGNDCLWVYGGE